MGIQIQFIETVDGTRKQQARRFLLRAEGGTWIGPEINFLPVKELPLVSRYEVKVTGTPEVVAARLESGYSSKVFAKPVQLADPRAIASGKIPHANPLPHQSLCEMRVTVGYFDADAGGKAVGPERTVTEVCILYTGAAPQLSPELVVRNRELVVLAGQAATQVVEVRNPRDADPKFGLTFPPTLVAPDDPALPRVRPLHADLKPALDAALAAAGARNDANPLSHEYRWSIDVRASQATRNALAEIEGGLSIPVDVTLDGATPERWLLRLEASTKAFHGWVVIDFGTTNSTVTVYSSWNTVPFDGFPEEQEEFLRKSLVEWLRKDAFEAFGKRSHPLEAEWTRLRAQTARMVNVGSTEALVEWLRGDTGRRLHELLALLEANLRLMSESFRRLAYGKLAKLYRDALRIPSLKRFHLFPIKLDPPNQTVSSEIEILGVAARPKGRGGDRWVDIRMGSEAQNGRLAAIGRGEMPLHQILQRFHPSPKRYFGTDKEPFPVELDGREELVSVDQLMRAGWAQLLKFTDEARRDEPGLSEGAFRRAIITYPTVAPPSVRQTIQRLMRDLGITDVRTDYDEAVASAIFYVMREYNAMPEMGLESFKSRCRIRTDAGWTQNVLVFDIGGGTTDVALIQLTLSEEAVFGPGEDRGAGGRYYKLTPKLLSSTGHMQLGGELMTLRIFWLLKAMIADRLLVLVQDNKLSCDAIKAVLDQLPEDAKQNNRYKAGWLREIIQVENPDNKSGALRDAKGLADALLPTRWRETSDARTARLQAFYFLWDHAEEAKKYLGGKFSERANEWFVLRHDKVASLLDECYPSGWQVKDAKRDLELRLTVEQAENATKKVVEDAVKIAVGALEHLPPDEKVDWLILSGQSCNLVSVDREIRLKFQASNRFVWNPERVTFLPEFAKLSTSIGACYAENQRRNRLPPRDSKKDLRRGSNILYFDVDNLFSFLPCSFLIPVGDSGGRYVFRTGEEMFDLQGTDDPEKQCGQIRSEVIGVPINIELKRKDSKDGVEPLWGSFDCQELIAKLKLSQAQWQEHVRMIFEIDHRLNVEVLLFRADRATDSPHHRLTGQEPRLNLNDVLPKAADRAAAARHKKAAAAGETVENPAAPPLPALFDDKHDLQWNIGIGTGNGVTLTVFEAKQKLDAVFHGPSPASPLRTILSKRPAEAFMDDHTLVVWGQPPGAQGWLSLGVIERPGDKPVFRRRYRLTLDERGVVRVYPGEPPHQESNDPQCLVDQPGFVFRRPLVPGNRDIDEDRNPFTGMH